MVLAGKLRACTSALLFLALCATSAEAVVHVDRQAPSGGDGTTWFTAYQRIQDGLTAAAASEDEVWVAAGTYRENIILRRAVRLYGGFLGTETSRHERCPSENETIIDGGHLGNTVIGAEQAVIDGFTITNGKASTSGGGVYCSYASSTISNCRITRNTGSGIYCYQSAPDIVNCTISENTDRGIYCYVGGNATIVNCVITENTAANYAGIYCYSVVPAIRRCTVTGNRATAANGSGGGLGFVSCPSPVTVENCVIANNSAAQGGGVYCSLSSPSFVNCTICDNSASSSGGNAYLQSCSPNFRNTIMAFGSAPLGAIASRTGSANPAFSFCNFWQEEESGWFEPASWDPTSEPNLTDDPHLLDRDHGDYHLSMSSPCVNAGTGAGVPQEDRDLYPRPYSGLWDIGAYEYAPLMPCDTVVDAKMISDGVRVSLTDAVVSGVFDGFLYVQQTGHASGIRVRWPSGTTLNRSVSVTGTMGTRDGIEREIRASDVSITGPGYVQPCGMPTRCLVGADLGDALPLGQMGRSAAQGPNNVGLLVRIWGRVLPDTSMGTAVTDGSDAGTLVCLPQGVASPPADSWVQITGISSVTAAGEEPASLLLVRDRTDIAMPD